MSRLRMQDGFALAELLVAMLLMVVVMSATLLVLDQMTAMSKRADTRVSLEDSARTASRQLARSLRNLAASPDLPGVVERAGPYDLVFRTVDRPRADAGLNASNLRRVRYCLDASDADAARIVEQTQRWNSATAPAVPPSTDCPGSGWEPGPPRVVAERVTNRAYTTERPLWTYSQTSGGQIAAVKLNLFVNDEPSNRAREVGLQTGVFLRNQNRAPSAAFTATAVGVRHVVLNASSSTDPDGQPLDFHWYVDGVKVGEGLLFDYYAPSAGTVSISLEVLDPGGLSDRSVAQAVELR